MTPEDKARKVIDKLFRNAGWQVLDRDHYAPNISAVALEEGLLNGNLEADYLLFLNGKAVGVLEAKKETVDVSADWVKAQAENYVKKVPATYQTIAKPLPLLYLSNGKTVLFRNGNIPDSEYEEINRIHSPKEITRMLGLEDEFSA